MVGTMEMRLRSIGRWIGLLPMALAVTWAAPPLRYEAPPHGYWERPLTDSFSRWWAAKAGELKEHPPAATELEAVRRVLAALEIPESSQMLVFSATSLQRTIGPHRPRALYFNDELYLGWVPGGRLEIAADDPDLGPVFFIVSLTRPGGGIGEPDRQTRCLNCHGNADTGNLPALLSASVLPDDAGGSLLKFRDPATGHQVPLADRFGGWHVTDAAPADVPLANLIGQSSAGTVHRLPNPPGQRFALNRYLRPTSALLPQIVHEHQVGGVNRLTAALYRARELDTPGHGPLSPEEASEVDRLATELVRYFLFADEAALPTDGVVGDPDFVRDFTANRRPDPQGRALKDLDLRTRIFTHRCSFLIYTPLWRHLPAMVKDRAWKTLDASLASEEPASHGAHLPPAERQAIREIIAATCTDRPEWWRP